MEYLLEHSTRYQYAANVTLSHNEARLLPRNLPWQTCKNTQLNIFPTPLRQHERRDFFGNRVVYFAIEELHSSLEVTVTSQVTTYAPPQFQYGTGPTWEEAKALLAPGSHKHALAADVATLEARIFTLDSPFAKRHSQLADFARNSFSSDRLLIDALQEFNQRIFQEFTYQPHFTTLATPVLEVLENRKGVCQDFAHLAIAALRSLGLAARYVSGYLETQPPTGQEKLKGADASHAWLSVFIPGYGWMNLDPTNGILPNQRYITLGWGRDYADITPLKGVMNGGGHHHLEVAVDVLPQNP
ncbi:Transglutaminase-like enzyme, putative cysteine protease [Marinospirillum celere]|uniref:Transglutaminase-like enzyme, putative cysteine protease n=1 Tax=Marinospirillum celere TaxID=1122252 RepID=A0A1I1E1X2_9GAMM|nr:transglutaminase family protein [Marinospirillum celere]SFB78960.1 Transglutaminase-like enzyme, putative cysteine protease [Marinospirillum celere]